VSTVSLRYDRAGRSDGTAFVTYANVADARTAIREFDGANAKGQPIRLTLLPIGPAAGRARQVGRRDNPFDRVENPRTLFDRIEPPKSRRGGRDRSASPDDYDSYDEGESRRRGARRGGAPPSRDRRSDVTKPPPENIDRYVPGQSDGRNSSRRNEGRDSGRRPGEKRERGGGSDRGRGGRDRSERGENGARMVNGRPRKTQEELDAEMEDYWGNANTVGGDAATPARNDNSHTTAPAATTVADDDIDMIE
jgi:THO complex subunit 4